MYDIEVKTSDTPYSIRMCDLKIGQLAKFDEHIILKSYSCIVSLTYPSCTWVSTSIAHVVPLPPNTEIILKVKE